MVDGRPINYQNGHHSSLEILVNGLVAECRLNRSDISVVGSLAIGMNKVLETRVHIPAKQNVIVTTAIDKNCQSAPFLAKDLFSEEFSDKSDQVKLFAKDNCLECSSSKWTWIKTVRLAEDCQSYNLELRSHSSKPTFTLTTTRRIQPSESPVLWFSQEILMSLRVPHLSLTNIQGEKKYTCHRCPFQCEMPNPLKIHLALECGKLTKEDLWLRLKPLRKSPAPSPLNFSITSSTLPMPFLPAAEPMSRTTSISAFKPYQKPEPKVVYEKQTKMRVEGMTKISLLPPPPLLTLHPTDVGCVEKASSGHRSLVTIDETTILYKRAMEMETIASNLGKFKQGHLCIYCGKVYSRKYGLKIHIRTHTGFKPLKCKFCLRPFGDPSNLNKHVRLHSEGDAPYKCDHCGKILVRKRDLDRHLKSRH